MRIIKYLGLTIGIGAIMYFMLISLLVAQPYISNFFNRTDFNSERWKNWEESVDTASLRWNMVDDLKKSHKLIGLTTTEVQNLLGKADRINRNGEWSYNLGMAGHGIDTGTLTITFKSDKVFDFQIIRG